MNIFDKLFVPDISKLETKKDTDGLKAALAHKDPAIRISALQALASLGEIEIVYSVYKQSSNDKALQDAALICIRIFSDREIASIVNSITRERQWTMLKQEIAKELAGIIGAPIVPVTLKEYFSKIRHQSVYWLPEVIEAVGTPAIEPLLATCKETLAGPSNNWASHIIEALGRLPDTRVADYILSLINQPLGESNLEAAIYALGRLNDRRAVKPLIDILENKTNYWGCRKAAASSLGKLGDNRAIEPLLNTLEDKDKLVRDAAANALGQLGVDASLESTADKLLGKLNSDDSTERKNAISLLGKLKIAQSFDAIKLFLEGHDADICEAASIALNNIDKDKAQTLIKSLCEVSHKFGESRPGLRFEELVTRCKRCGYEKREQRRCKKCGGTQFEVERHDWNDTDLVVCKSCRAEAV